MSKAALKPQIIETGRNSRLVVLTEEEYDHLLDVIDNFIAKQIEEDESDPIVNWDDVKDTIAPTRGKNSKSRKKAQGKK